MESLLARPQKVSNKVSMLCNMYVSHSARVQWNGICSTTFEVLNGVKQGGIISPILFCVYIDDLLLLLSQNEVGCFIGSWFIGALANAEDIVLLAPSASALRAMLHVFNVVSDSCNAPMSRL